MRKLTLSVQDDLPEILVSVSGGQRKISKWLDGVARAAHAGQNIDQNEVDGMKLQIIGLSAELNSLKARMQLLEDKL